MSLYSIDSKEKQRIKLLFFIAFYYNLNTYNTAKKIEINIPK